MEASGEVTGDDYKNVLVPLIDAAHVGGSKVRLLYVLGEVSVSASGAWADTKLGIEHFASFERIAVVTDTDWVEHAVRALGWVIPGEVKVFDDDERDEAISWLASD